jgi:aconitase A
VPHTVKVLLRGNISASVSAKDISLFLLKRLSGDEVLNKAVDVT